MDSDDSLRQMLGTDADRYFERNKSRDAKVDPVIPSIDLIQQSGPIGSLLEVGSFDGHRLGVIRRKLGCACVGIEASGLACESARVAHNDITFIHGVAPWALEKELSGQTFDVIILGFVLYLLPRHLLFRLAAAVDERLSVGGHLVVYDFLSNVPQSRQYQHDSSLRTYKLDYSTAWLWNPQYHLVSRIVAAHDGTPTWPEDQSDWVCVDVVRKRETFESYQSRD